MPFFFAASQAAGGGFGSRTLLHILRKIPRCNAQSRV
nr:MAG TPA: hypothetical protein [Caudoviricetes sp.]